jgi:hypothetical protein
MGVARPAMRLQLALRHVFGIRRQL